MVNLKLNTQPIKFKLDTGAAVTAVPDTMKSLMMNIAQQTKS